LQDSWPAPWSIFHLTPAGLLCRSLNLPLFLYACTGANDQQEQLQQRQKQLLANKEQLVEQQRVVEPDKL
jgi:hypothetical protein